VPAKPFTAETLSGEMSRGAFPEVRRLMLDFVGEYLLDFENAARSVGLTLAQARVLGYAAIKPSSMREIADQFGSDPSNITAKVDRLLELGLVERLADPGDGRVKLVAATPKGVALSAKLCDNRAWLARVLGDLESDEVGQVKSALELLLREPDLPVRPT
jgi:DNA-binding MarR family transcriptional regulator